MPLSSRAQSKSEEYTHLKNSETFGYSTFVTDLALMNFIRRYERDPKPIPVRFRKLVTCLPSIDRATHIVHPYPAKLLCHIPFFFLANTTLSKSGDVVLDPFCGSGTVLLEAQLSGRIGWGADANPFARLLTSVKTSKISKNTIKRASARLLQRIENSPQMEPPDVINLDYWFYPHVIKQLQCILEAIKRTQDLVIKNFFLVTFSACVKKVSLADPRLSVPVKLSHLSLKRNTPFGKKSITHLKKLRRINVRRLFESALNTNLERVMKIETVKSQASIISCDARTLNCPNDSVQLIITSPPYPGAQKYIRSCSLSLGWLGLCNKNSLATLKYQAIGREEVRNAQSSKLITTGIEKLDLLLECINRKNRTRGQIMNQYILDMKASLEEMHRALKSNGFLVLVVSQSRVCGRVFDTPSYLIEICKRLGLKLKFQLIDQIKSRGLMTKRHHTARVISNESVLLFSKDV